MQCADILRVMPSKAIELSAFDAYKKFLSHEDEQGKLKRPGPLLTALAGAAAGRSKDFANPARPGPPLPCPAHAQV